MTSVLGLDVATAEKLLKAEGKPVRFVEVRSKKGGKGDDRRVIKTTETETETIVYWSAFKTEVTTLPSRHSLDTSPCTGEAETTTLPSRHSLDTSPCTGEADR